MYDNDVLELNRSPEQRFSALLTHRPPVGQFN